MKKTMPPVETRFTDLSGNISVNLKENIDFTQLTSDLAGFNPDRFEPIAIRVFMENETQVTIYAIDKNKQENWDKTEKLPVHKFKLDAGFAKLLPLIRQINFTLSTGEYNLEDMEVINK